MPAILAEQLNHFYGPRRALTDVRLSVAEGTIHGFLGPNGAGKTTTIRILLGFLRASSGNASVFGLDAWRDTTRIKRDIGSIPGDLRLWPWLTGKSALSLFGQIRGLDIAPEGRRLADRFELDLKLNVRRMSKGTRQKLGLVLAMAHRPRLLVLDEPSTGLDPIMQDRFRELLRETAADGRTVFLSSHTLSEVESLCDRVTIVRKGRVVADSTIAELQSRAGHRVSVRWAADAGARPAPPMLALDRAGPQFWEGTLQGPVTPLLQFLGSAPGVEDVTIERADLEALFRRFYADDPPAEATAPAHAR